ncbi:Crp/Fnr family transcriptional regulator [Alteriqipengyuania lutimaris]|uniref:Crp/Fnr family transcriptional regulator n=1 Tax=Alteriqipengyuania lutimaris TaxID=1538146 RepID=A0A395LQU6_9SPHN|nr:Crp/Fnr family transcriptional regulator [Alteriqipengyuania lutimaris]MBB3034011.1 CRP-like cAMP-binding protein [Alteriqipengyuania lutimaris]RDS77040.1 Crp/Fnr family transcriptional regulator [Alteriqipengyuania lutimaris]
MTLEDEMRDFPLTGRFLFGRLRDTLTREERERLEQLPEEVATYESSSRIVESGTACGRSTLLVEGFIIRGLERTNGSGTRRSALSVHVPGDFVDLHCFALKRLDHNVDTIGPAKLAYVPHEKLREVLRDAPNLARLLWSSTLLDAAMHRQWILKLEQLTTPGRIAHIFAELWRRLEMIGMAGNDGFRTPLTQADLADMSGATAVHANRALRELREKGVAEFKRGRVTVADRAALEKYAGFAPDYLYGEGELALRREHFAI